MLPLALLFLALDAYVGSNSMLLACLPFANVLSSVGPAESAFAFTFVINELSFVLFLVFPDQDSLAMHLVVAPLSIILLSVRPVVLANATNLILLELSFVIAAVGES
jgi:hypothetical protein